jgi:hypothetical protein
MRRIVRVVTGSSIGRRVAVLTAVSLISGAAILQGACWRGGSFDDDPFFLRASNRSNDFFPGFQHSTVGFRVVWPLAGGRD